MATRRRKAAKAIAAMLIFCVSQICVQMNLRGQTAPAVSSMNDVRPRRAGGSEVTVLRGQLVTSGNSAILINGNNVKSGMTVLSGAQMQTPADISASVYLAGDGRLDLAPNTSLTLTFNERDVNVGVSKGCVILLTQQGINGAVSTPQGTVARTDPSRRSFVDICLGATDGAPPVINEGMAAKSGAGACGLPSNFDSAPTPFFGLPLLAMLTGAGGAVIAGTLGGDTERGVTSSSGTP